MVQPPPTLSCHSPAWHTTCDWPERGGHSSDRFVKPAKSRLKKLKLEHSDHEVAKETSFPKLICHVSGGQLGSQSYPSWIPKNDSAIVDQYNKFAKTEIAAAIVVYSCRIPCNHLVVWIDRFRVGFVASKAALFHRSAPCWKVSSDTCQFTPFCFLTKLSSKSHGMVSCGRPG